jgi:starch phosphorylase
MKSSIAKLCPVFNMHRMVREYTSEYYLVAHDRCAALSGEGAAGAKKLATWLDKLAGAWPRLRVESMDDSVPEIALGKPLKVAAQIFLDVLTPDDVTVEIVTGRVNADGDITDFFTTSMQPSGQNSENSYRFEAEIQPGSHSGQYGYAIRVLPKHRELVTPFLPGLILWACGSAAVPGSREAHYAVAR